MKKGLVIGINYKGSGSDLNGCINDCIAIRNVLVDAYGYGLDNIKILRDDKPDDKQNMPTKLNILREISNLIKESSELTELWIHYSGHGIFMNDANSDEKDGRDEALVPCDYQRCGVIKDDDLRRLLDNVKCKTILTMDCCHSGSIWDITYAFPIKNGSVVREIENNKQMNNQNVYMLAAARDVETAADYFNFESRLPMGGFTMGLIETLRRFNHNVDIMELYVNLYKWLEKSGYEQRCLLSSSNPNPELRIQRESVNDNNNIVEIKNQNSRFISISTNKKRGLKTKVKSKPSVNMRNRMFNIIYS